MSTDAGAPDGRLRRSVRSAAALAGAPAEVLDFLLPLWAGSTLKAGPTAVGALIAVEAVLSLLVRPLAGELADRTDPRRLAAASAGVYALSFAGYALADSLPLAFAAAALGGAGGALFWVALDTWTGRYAATGGSAAYGSLLAASGQGAFVGYLVALSAVEEGGYPLLFWLGAGACAAAAVLLAVDRAPAEPDGPAAGSEGAGGPAPLRRLLPLMTAAAVTAGAEAGLWMILLLRLQGESGLRPGEIALVFAPGFVVFILVPTYAHLVTDRLGRARTMTISFVASALFAGGLGLFSGPIAVAVLWTLVAACFAAQMPVEQATVAAAAGGRIGRAMGLYESARLIGVLIGPVLLGALHEWRGWGTACAVAAAAAALCAAAAPFAVRVLRLPPEPAAAGRTGEDGADPMKKSEEAQR